MSRTLSANQLVKVDRPYVQPVYLMKITPLSGNPMYFSDRNITYNSITYEAYLKNLDTIGETIHNLGGYDNFQLTLEFMNQEYRGNNYLIENFDDNVVEKRFVEIWKLFIDTGETFGSDVSTKIFKGELGNPYDITELEFKIDVQSMLFGKSAKLPLDKIDYADFPEADPDDVGKYRNIIYGSLKKVICPWTVAGWLSTLTADITSAQLSIVVSDSNGCPATPFTALVENEQVRVTGNTKATGTLVVTRGYGGTSAVAHNKGVSIYHMRSDFQADVAQHPVKSIGDIFVEKDNEWVRVISGATKYINTAGHAYIRFSDKVKFEEKTNLVSSLGSEPHLHTVNASAQYSSKICIPTGATGGLNPTNAIDGNEDTYATEAAGSTLTCTFTETDFGTINKQYIHVLKRDGFTSGHVICGGTDFGTMSAGAGWRRFVKMGGVWTDNITVQAGLSGNQISEVYKEIEYTPNAPTVNNTTLTPSLSGNSLANIIIGDRVACDVEGYQDDVSGTYTGTPNALIERPDHVRKHILIALLGFAVGDLDLAGSWTTTGAQYNSRVYKFAFVVHEVAIETMDLFQKMDQQTRTTMFESAGVFKLTFMLTSAPTSQKTFDNNNIKGFFTFSKSEVADLRNKFIGHYFRDYTKFGDLGVEYQKILELTDATSISKYGTMEEDLEFSCVGDLVAMVDDVMDWILLEQKELKKLVSFTAFWDATLLESCDYFTVESNFWNGLVFKTIKLIERMSDQTIDINGLEFTS